MLSLKIFTLLQYNKANLKFLFTKQSIKSKVLNKFANKKHNAKNIIIKLTYEP